MKQIRKRINLFLCSIIILCGNLCSCDLTIYPEFGHYFCKEPYFELYYNIDYDTPGNSQMEYNGEVTDANLNILGSAGSIVIIDSNGNDMEYPYYVKWNLDENGNIIMERYTYKDTDEFAIEYYDTITLEKQ